MFFHVVLDIANLFTRIYYQFGIFDTTDKWHIYGISPVNFSYFDDYCTRLQLHRD